MLDENNITAFSDDNIESILKRELTMVSEDTHPQAHPKAILLAGQPGAGKTELSSMMVASLHGDAAFINGDDFRRYHPNYRELFERYGSDAVQMISPFSNAVVERIIAEFSDHHFHLVIEGTGRDANVPKSTAELLVAKGYTTELAVIAARPEISLISTMLRFYNMNERGTIPRATAITAHDNVVAALPSNLDILRDIPSISRITIWDRELEILYDSTINTAYPSKILHDYWHRAWSAYEIQSAKEQIALLREMEQRAQLGQSAVIDEIKHRVDSVPRSQGFSFGMSMY